MKINDIIKQWKTEAKHTNIIQFKYSYFSGCLFICTYLPGYLIGEKGVLYQKYLEILKTELPELKKITFIDTDIEII